MGGLALCNRVAPAFFNPAFTIASLNMDRNNTRLPLSVRVWQCLMHPFFIVSVEVMSVVHQAARNGVHKRPTEKSVLVTGGTGFIGQHLVEKLLAEGCQVYVLTREAGRYTDNGRIAYIQGDFTRADHLMPLLARIDTVYHLAVTTIPGRANKQIQYDAQTNLMGSLSLIDQAARAGVRRFIFTSSGGSVYGLNGGRPIDENHPTDPISAHGVSKLAIEKYLEIYRRTQGMEYRIARTANPYGEGQDPDRGQGFIAYALGRFARNRPLEIWGDGSVVRDYIYVKDVAEVLWLMMRDNGPHTLYNVGSGTGHSVNEMIVCLEEMMGRAASVHYVEARPADVPYNCLNIKRAQAALGWQPTTPLALGLQRTWTWVQRYVHNQDVAVLATP